MFNEESGGVETLRVDFEFLYLSIRHIVWQVNLTGIPHGLSFQETKELWVRADLDGNGVFDCEELKVN